MGKITVKHYLNKSLSNKENRSDRHYIYVQVTVKRQVNRMRSRANKIAWVTDIELQVSQQDLDNSLTGGDDLGLGKALALEHNIIHDIITFLRPFERNDFTLKAFTPIYEVCTEDMLEFIAQKGRDLLREMMREFYPQPFYIIDWEKPYYELIGGLTELGEQNQLFVASVLENKYIQCFTIAHENIVEFLHLNFDYDDRFKAYRGNLTFYWFRDNHTQEFISFLKKKNVMTMEQLPAMEEIFEAMYHSVITEIEELSG
ncbi:hypothetical protein EFA69_19020 [Rufibacter immobilis]|uniref:Uncharacterized protein n=1 Tax=Rufibacter immobilis TaxID=1348778 RepID=A0A3M9MSH8_9BACT|nr:hypothetical protein [Rufibacter immobilis]RNI28165.1 hypothetical protein EFA69_19020 [Rufibacter immobilis]